MEPSGEVFNDQWWSLMISVVIWVPTTIMVMRGAMLGSRAHAWPRLMYGFGALILSCLYFADLVNWIPHSEFGMWARGVGWYMAIAISLTAWTGVRYGKKVERAAQQLSEAADRGERDGQSA